MEQPNIPLASLSQLHDNSLTAANPTRLSRMRLSQPQLDARDIFKQTATEPDLQTPFMCWTAGTPLSG